MSRPILGISMGDPFGNGPEITVRALADATIYDRCKPLVVGDESSMRYALKVAEKVNGIHLECTDEEVAETGLAVASGEKSYEELLEWVEGHKV